MDVHTPAQRRRNMQAIRGKNTTPERVVRSILHKMGYRFRLHRNDLPGKPDIVLPKYKTVLFVHGCFWHRHSRCRYASTPQTRRRFWQKKFEDNVKRDRFVRRQLNKWGWKVVVIWECETRDNDRLQEIIRKRIPRRNSSADVSGM